MHHAYVCMYVCYIYICVCVSPCSIFYIRASTSHDSKFRKPYKMCRDVVNTKYLKLQIKVPHYYTSTRAHLILLVINYDV